VNAAMRHNGRMPLHRPPQPEPVDPDRDAPPRGPDDPPPHNPV